MSDSFNIKDYVIDFERIELLTNNGAVKVAPSSTLSSYSQKEFTTVSSLLMHKFVTEFLKYSISNSILNNDNILFVINTLIYNKILIKPRVGKIEKILKS